MDRTTMFKTLRSLVKNRTYTAAALELGFPYPTRVIQRIAELEQELGIKLVVSSGSNSIAITSAAEKLAELADLVLECEAKLNAIVEENTELPVLHVPTRIWTNYDLHVRKVTNDGFIIKSFGDDSWSSRFDTGAAHCLTELKSSTKHNGIVVSKEKYYKYKPTDAAQATVYPNKWLLEAIDTSHPKVLRTNLHSTEKTDSKLVLSKKSVWVNSRDVLTYVFASQGVDIDEIFEVDLVLLPATQLGTIPKSIEVFCEDLENELKHRL